MISVQKAIFPGIALGCVFLVFITNLLTRPGSSLAKNLASAQSQPNVVEPVQSQGMVKFSLPVVGAHADSPTPTPKPAVPTQPVEVEQPAAAEQPSAEEQPAVGDQNNQENCGISAGYPQAVQQWCSLIQHAADENGLDPNLIAAVMLQESGGNPDAYSRNGAVGLMQVMPRDGLAAGFMCVNGPCFGKRPSIAELSDPEFNINYGAGMLAGLIHKHGDVREGLLYYGPMNMGYRYADIVLGIMSRYQ
jgi:soluble lytic murein transglycosylase-like protein